VRRDMKSATSFVGRAAFAALMLMGIAGASVAADLAALRFAGVLVSQGRTNVVLVDSSDGHSSGWIQIGQRFEDAVIERYDPKNETLIVSYAGTIRSIPLESGKTLSSGRMVQLGVLSYQVFADETRSENGKLFFHGHVTALHPKSHVSAQDASFDSATGKFSFDGKVQIQRGDVLVSGTHVELSADDNDGKLRVTAPAIRLEPKP